ncbi:MAG: diacylglycerol kinase family protein [Bacteroidetes bacterium]|nr:diacylglycerol kinase family protein [Bacteroidota bacterium]
MLNSFKYALSGILSAVKTERNLKIHFVVLLIVIVLGITVSITRYEWLAILMVSGLVIAMELLNTSLEKLCDKFSKDKSAEIKFIKDAAAGSVLIAAVIAVIIAIIIFYPYIVLLISE